MSTEKSLLKWSDAIVQFAKLEVPKSRQELIIPLGITDDDLVLSVTLDSSSPNEHMCLMGHVGSGKSSSIHSLLATLQALYGDSLRISYLDGKDCEYKKWLNDKGKPRFSRYGVVCGVSDAQWLSFHLGEVYSQSLARTATRHLLVLDEVNHILNDDVVNILKMIAANGPSNGLHILLTSQSRCRIAGNSSALDNVLKEWEVVCLIRCKKEDAMFFHGCTVASDLKEKYGYMVVATAPKEVTRVRVPFIDYHEIRRLF